MSETTLPLTCLCLLFGYAAWAYRGDYLDLMKAHNEWIASANEAIRRHRNERDMLTASNKEAWEAYKRAFLISLDTDKARIAAEDHVKYLRTQLDEAKARAEAAERSQEDTEAYDQIARNC